MAINFQNGLLGMGGLGGMFGSNANQMSLLGGLYDPQEIQKQKIKQGLLAAGVNMLAQGPSQYPINMGTALGQGMSKGLEAANQAEQDYRNNAIQMYGINRMAENDAYQRQQDAANMDWRQTQFDYTKQKDATEFELQRQKLAREQQQAAKYGLNPIWLEDGKGNYKLVQPSQDGSAPREMAFPEGYRPAPPTRTLDLGTSYQTVPTRGAPVPIGEPSQIDNVGKAAQQEIGAAQGKGVVAAPGDVAAADVALNLIDQIKTSPNREWGTGGTSVFNVIPGLPGYDFQNLVDQTKSGAFLTAIQQMRGLGALSNAEGDAATKAITRLNTATSEEAFMKALEDYERIVRLGRARAEAKMSGGAQPVPQADSPPAQGSVQEFNWTPEKGLH